MSGRLLANLVLVPTILLTLGVNASRVAALGEEARGSGPAFGNPWAIAIEANGNLVVTDRGLEAVVRVNPVSGERTIVSDANIGSGPEFGSPWAIAIEANGNLLVTDRGLEAVVRVNPLSGERTIVSDADTGSMREAKYHPGDPHRPAVG